MTATLRPDGLQVPTTAFGAAIVDLIVDVFNTHPTWGTAVGYHAGDGRWPDLTEDGRQARLRMLREHAARLEAFDRSKLTDEEGVDLRIALEEIEQLRFADELLREEATDPLAAVYLMGSGIFALLSREFAPWPVRATSLLTRLEQLPDLTRQALAALSGLPDRPVSLLHLDTALAQLGGVTELVDAGVAEARRRSEAGEAPDLVAPLEAAAEGARAAIEAFRESLDGDVRRRASGEGRLGRELFEAKLRLTLGSDISPEELRRRARADVDAVRSEMLRLARELWSTWIPDEPLPETAPDDLEAESRLVRRVLDAIGEVHQSPDALIGYCEAEIARIEAFCREHGVITLPEEPLTITWTPLFMRAYGRAFLDSPGPLDRGQKSFFWITPPDASSGAEAVESYLREDNDSMLRTLCIHEGIPGHYLQLAASNRSPSLVRTVFTNGMFAEGWAVYVTQVMIDLGYGADDPGLLLTHWKLYLRAVVNALLDVETHTGSMTEAEAMALMVDQAWQERDEAGAKWLRARLTATQLSTYYVGSLEMWDLEVAARQRAAHAVGAGDNAVPEQRIVGGLGTTPGFDQRAHLEAVVSHGTPPIRWCRRLVLGDEG